MSNDDNVIRVDFGTGKKIEDPAKATSLTKRKLEAFKEALSHGTVFIRLDARREDVVVPAYLKQYYDVGLNFDYRFNIDDFEFDETSVRATLSFSGEDSWCNVPWDAVYQISNKGTGVGVVYDESLPKTLK